MSVKALERDDWIVLRGFDQKVVATLCKSRINNTLSTVFYTHLFQLSVYFAPFSNGTVVKASQIIHRCNGNGTIWAKNKNQ